jgi:hypothetical protein
MTNQKLKEIRARTEKNASLRSDDFGHDTHALLLAESDALQIAADDIAYLLSLCDKQSRAIEHLKGEIIRECICEKIHPDIGPCDFCLSVKEVDQILSEGE